MGDLDRAESLFTDALAVPPGQLHEVECRSRIGLAQVYIAKRRFEEAGVLLGKSLAAAMAGNYLELEWQASYLQGQVYRQMGNTTAAQNSLMKSVAALERLRGMIMSLDLRQQFLERRYDPYKEIVSLLYDDLHDHNQALEFIGRAKSMSLREFLNGKVNDPAPGLGHINPDLRALGIDYFFTGKELLAIVSDSERNDLIKLQVSRSQIAQMVQDFLDSILRNDEAAFRVLSRKLNDELIAPVLHRAETNGYKNILIFPDGPLHLLPFGGLQDTDGRFLLEKYALSYAPSRSVLRHCLSLGRGSAASRDRTVLLLDGTNNLQGADLEFAHLSSLYHNRAHLLTSRDMSAVGRFAGAAEIIHFSGHASLINGKPALLLQPSLGQAYLDFDDVLSWRLSSNRLVMLAGCNTGIGPQTEGETPWGLIPAFLNAGAPALIVSLLPVDDKTTAGLTARFYDLLASSSISKTAALQQAQLFLLASARAQGHMYPSSWLPFVLVGDPR
jgi:CHAT domain-containing protein